MKKLAIVVAMITFMLTMTTACSQTKVEELSQEVNEQLAVKRLYDYAEIYKYHEMDPDKMDYLQLCSLLQPKDLEIYNVEYQKDHGILQINYELNLSEDNRQYIVNYTKHAQDSIVLLATLDYLNGVEFNYIQDNEYGYCFGGSPMLRSEVDEIFGESTLEYGKSEDIFTQQLPNKVEAIIYEPEIMSEIQFEHIAGLD